MLLLRSCPAALALWFCLPHAATAATLLASPATSPRPELTIVNVGAVPVRSCGAGETVLTFDVVVKNIGNAASPADSPPGSLHVADTTLPEWTADAVIPTLAPGASANLKVELAWYAPAPLKMAGTHHFVVTARAGHRPVGSNLANNAFQGNFATHFDNGRCTDSTSLTLKAGTLKAGTLDPLPAPSTTPPPSATSGLHREPKSPISFSPGPTPRPVRINSSALLNGLTVLAKIAAPQQLMSTNDPDLCQTLFWDKTLSCAAAMAAGNLVLGWHMLPCSDDPHCVAADGFNIHRQSDDKIVSRVDWTAGLGGAATFVSPWSPSDCFAVRAFITNPTDATIKESAPSNVFCASSARTGLTSISLDPSHALVASSAAFKPTSCGPQTPVPIPAHASGAVWVGSTGFENGCGVAYHGHVWFDLTGVILPAWSATLNVPWLGNSGGSGNKSPCATHIALASVDWASLHSDPLNSLVGWTGDALSLPSSGQGAVDVTGLINAVHYQHYNWGFTISGDESGGAYHDCLSQYGTFQLTIQTFAR